MTLIGNEKAETKTGLYISIRNGLIYLGLGAYKLLGNPEYVQIGIKVANGKDRLEIFSCKKESESAHEVKANETYAYIKETGKLASYLAEKNKKKGTFRIPCEKGITNDKTSIGFEV